MLDPIIQDNKYNGELVIIEIKYVYGMFINSNHLYHTFMQPTFKNTATAIKANRYFSTLRTNFLHEYSTHEQSKQPNY